MSADQKVGILAQVQAKPAPERLEIAFTWLHLSAILTGAETRWIATLVRERMHLRPEVQEEGFGS